MVEGAGQSDARPADLIVAGAAAGGSQPAHERVPFGRPSDYATHAPGWSTTFGTEGSSHTRLRRLRLRLHPRPGARAPGPQSSRAKPFLLLVLDRSQAVGLDWTEDARRLAGRSPGRTSRRLAAVPGTRNGVDGTVAVGRPQGAGAPGTARRADHVDQREPAGRTAGDGRGPGPAVAAAVGAGSDL